MKDEEVKPNALETALMEADEEKPLPVEKTFGLGAAKKSLIVSRGFTLNEIVKASK